MKLYLIALVALISSCVSEKKVGLENNLLCWRHSLKQSLTDSNGNAIVNSDSILINSITGISDEALKKISDRVFSCDNHFVNDDFFILSYHCEGEVSQNEILLLSTSSICEVKGVLGIDNSFSLISRIKANSKKDLLDRLLNGTQKNDFVINKVMVSHFIDGKFINKVVTITRANIELFDSLTIWYRK